jgi:hypothetical protein
MKYFLNRKIAVIKKESDLFFSVIEVGFAK